MEAPVFQDSAAMQLMTTAGCAVFIGFMPITTEAFDLVMRHPDEFEPALQHLMGFARSAEFAAEAERLGGYELISAGTVILNY